MRHPGNGREPENRIGTGTTTTATTAATAATTRGNSNSNNNNQNNNYNNNYDISSLHASRFVAPIC